ncbi:hypothetical protein [Primorskyibacter sp. S187A]|uniref:hypothetical protein n=1 Tax=Primorskyibacter sp. S187A TaxID=3415130 RepID=UPI003C7CA921
MKTLVSAAALLAASTYMAAAAPISLEYSVTDLGGSYQYDFTLTADNADGTLEAGWGWDWFVIGDATFGAPAIFPEGRLFFTDLPAGWDATSTSGGSNGPTLGAVDGSVVGAVWTPEEGDFVTFSGVSSELVAEGDLVWTSLVPRGGASSIIREVATLAPVPLPASGLLFMAALPFLAWGRRKAA